jgi:transcriptional regulator with XRE-family HTH domain
VYGSAVRRARVERGLTQVQLAEISGVEQSNISAIENGRRAPSAETLHRLLLACGFDLLAEAGTRTFAIPAPDGAELGGEVLEPVALPMATRVRMLTAALDAAEAIVRSR